MTFAKCLRALLCAFTTVALVACAEPQQDNAVQDETVVSYEEFLKTHPKLYSQNDEEVIIRHFFGDRRDGFYLDVGCAWAKKISTTYYLEEHLEWTGIGIDALDSYKATWDQKRPKSKFISYAITDHTGDTITFYELGPISSVHEDWADQFGKKGKPIEVSTITLNDLLAEQGVEKIDFMSMDIEGAEPAALAGFDIRRYGVEFVCIEAHASEDQENSILAYFEENGYERIEEYLPHDIGNWYFKRKK